MVATLIAFVLAEAAGGAALFVLEWRTGYGYQAVDTLSSAHREILEALEEGTFRYFIADGVLGWSLQPNGSRDSYAANSDGIRASTTGRRSTPVYSHAIPTPPTATAPRR